MEDRVSWFEPHSYYMNSTLKGIVYECVRFAHLRRKTDMRHAKKLTNSDVKKPQTDERLWKVAKQRCANRTFTTEASQTRAWYSRFLLNPRNPNKRNPFTTSLKTHPKHFYMGGGGRGGFLASRLYISRDFPKISGKWWGIRHRLNWPYFAPLT